MIRRKCFVLCIVFFTSIISVFASNNYRVDWADGTIYSSAVFTLGRDYTYPAQYLLLQEEAKNQAEINFYRVFKSIEVSDNGQNLYDYMDSMGERKALLFSLLNKAHLHKLEYPLGNRDIKVTYSIQLYGRENSIMNILLGDRSQYTQELPAFIGETYENDYTGIVIDARGELTSFSGEKVKISPSLFLTVRDANGDVVFNRYNVRPDVLLERGMVKYSYDIKDSESNPNGAYLEISEEYADGLLIKLSDLSKSLRAEIDGIVVACNKGGISKEKARSTLAKALVTELSGKFASTGIMVNNLEELLFAYTREFAVGREKILLKGGVSLKSLILLKSDLKRTEKRAGNNPLRIVAYGAGSKSGSVIVISNKNAKEILAAASTRKAIADGKIEVVIDDDYGFVGTNN
ncbi:MAG: hypothetical protein II258_04385 [Spirochaetales bacterium]|nr:hypothetical protein [Spirochaetales bacterium]